MLNCFKQKNGRFVCAVILAMASSLAPVSAQNRLQDAHITLSTLSGGFLVGYTKGTGALTFKGQSHPLTLSGPLFATIGIGTTTAIGQVYHLSEASDLEGRYHVIEGGLTLGQGGGHTLLSNGKGVEIYLQNLQQGAALTLGGGSVEIALTLPASPEPPKSSEASPPADSSSPHSHAFQDPPDLGHDGS